MKYYYIEIKLYHIKDELNFHIHRGVQLYILTFINYLLNLTFINTHLLVITSLITRATRVW